MGYAYLADGKLYFAASEGSPPALLESDFVEQFRDRQARSRERQGWKSGASWFSVSGGRNLIPHADAQMADPSLRQVRFTGACAGPTSGELVYAIDTGAAGGLFHYQAVDDSERRMLHKAGFHAVDLALHPDRSKLAMSLPMPDGAANIGTMEMSGRGIREVTDGDSLDQAPSWHVEGEKTAIYFQSAGIARNAMGMAVTQGPYAIMRLDLSGENLHTVLEDDGFDLLTPKVDAGGSLLFIRRPYSPSGQTQISPLKVAGDVLLFPFRLIRAIVHFLNWFSMVFARKPMLTAGGPPKQGPDQRYVMLWGKLVDAEKAIRQAERAGDGRAIVPKSWELVRRDSGGDEQVLASSVVSFDVAADGAIVYTNGSKIFAIDSAGKQRELGDGKLIERLLAVG